MNTNESVDVKSNNKQLIAGVDFIYTYVRSEKSRDKIGVVAAVKIPNTTEVFVSGSLCNKMDRFDKNRGLLIAVERAVMRGAGRDIVVANSLAAPLKALGERAGRFFKGHTITVCGVHDRDDGGWGERGDTPKQEFVDIIKNLISH